MIIILHFLNNSKNYYWYKSYNNFSIALSLSLSCDALVARYRLDQHTSKAFIIIRNFTVSHNRARGF